MPSFDIVSELDLQEVDNAVNQAKKEVGQRYDFRGTNTEIERTEQGIVIRSADEEHVKAAYKVLQERMLKRSVSLLALDAGEVEPAGKNTARQLVQLREGIATDKAKEIVRLLKDSKLKVQAQMKDEQLRVTGKNRDDLQAAMKVVRGAELDLPLQYKNFRD